MGELKETDKAAATKQELLTGKDILKSYKEGDSDGLTKYNQMCRALDLLPNWDDKSKLDFFVQFWGLSDLMDAQCSSLIIKFCKVEWELLPPSIRPLFVELLRNVAIRHVMHTEFVFHSLTSHFIQKMKIEATEEVVEFVPSISDEEQEGIFNLAHSAIATILDCFPMSINTLLETCRANFPHHSAPSEKYLSYVRNMVILTEYATPIRSKIWSTLLQNLIQIDALLSHPLDENHMISPVISDDSGVFTLDEEHMDVDQVVPLSKHDEGLRRKLDHSLLITFRYISRGHPKISICSHDEDPLLNRIMEMGDPDFNMLNVFLPAFDEYILSAHGVQSVPFIWFYLCSLDEQNMSKMFQHLWRTIITPVNSPNDWKKSQNAASFLAGFLGRGKFVKFLTAMNWMKCMASWANQYVDQADLSKMNTAGGIQHGTFYSVVQALLFVFCFRYREILEKNYVDELQSWGFGKILHSHFEPLKFISSVIAECFAAVSRCVQLVYVSHMLRTFELNHQLPIEPYFPFSFLQLPKCAKIIGDNLRVFQPTEEDKATLAKELSFKHLRSRQQSVKSSDEFDFMNSDDLGLENREAVRAALSSSPFVALASTTPQTYYA